MQLITRTLLFSLLLCMTLLSKNSHANSSPQDSSQCSIMLEEFHTCLQVSWTVGPAYNTYSRARLTFWSIEQSGELSRHPQDPSFPWEAYPWMVMPRHQHGTRPVRLIKESEGVYRLEKIWLMKMVGHWELRIKRVGSSNHNPLGQVKIEFNE